MKSLFEESRDQFVEHFTLERTKECLKKRYERFTETKWTRYFIITSIIQAIFAIVFISRMLDRNNKAGDEFKNAAKDNNDKCVNSIINRIGNIVGENVVFLIFNIFQLWFCQNAICNQNTIQIINIAIINYLCALFAIVQIVEIDIWKAKASDCLSGTFDYKPRIAAYEVPLIAILVICATLQVFFTWKLCQQFGWNIYKKIGADLGMQKLYRSMLIFVMLLKIDLFFMNFLAIEGCIVTRPGRLNQNLHEGLYYFHVCITIIIVFLQLLVWQSLRTESSLGMKIFIGAWIVCIADFIILLEDSIKSSSDESWYFFTCFIVVGILMGLITLVWAIFLLRNFGKGLKPHLSRRNNTSTLPTQQPPNMTDPSVPQQNTGGRWAIDD